MAKILKKISISTIVSMKVKELRTYAEEHKRAPLARIMGICKKVEIGEGDNGEFKKFSGDFRAVNLLTGEESISTVCFLASPVDELLYNQIQSLIDEGEKNPEARFGFDIYIEESEKSTTGYTYVVETLMQAEPTDPMKELMKEFESKPLPALDAPNTVSEPAEK